LISAQLPVPWVVKFRGAKSSRPVPAIGRRTDQLSIRIVPGAPAGFIVFSFAGDDPFACKDYVRERLGLPEWEHGDEQDRRVEPSRRARFDRRDGRP